MAEIFDNRQCELGEGPLWHPVLHQLFWFDILAKKLLSQKNGHQLEWQFDTHVSAAGWVDESTLLIASETSLFKFNLETFEQTFLCALEANDPTTRSNDGRADPYGGFWIGTMGKNAEQHAGAIYRYYKGELRKLFSNITISNAICFSPDKKFAYYCDTVSKQIMRQGLNPNNGWPEGDSQIFIDLTKEGHNPDGMVVDAAGNLWNAQWGASRIAVYNSSGQFLEAHQLPAPQMTCPAFGGAELTHLFATSAFEGIGKPNQSDGRTFVLKTIVKGQAEHQVIV